MKIICVSAFTLVLFCLPRSIDAQDKETLRDKVYSSEQDREIIRKNARSDFELIMPFAAKIAEDIISSVRKYKEGKSYIP
ncbi:MAG: hypothetical protein KDD10_15845 [Phaeodactylibacter sp.]|nr:hypothetical protein [Phaeodactylibacter sp.]